MVKEIQLRIKLNEEIIEGILNIKASKALKVDLKDISGLKILQKSIDARKETIVFNYKVAVYLREKMLEVPSYSFPYQDVSNSKEVHIIGFGPAGMYAALRCIELGFKPIVFERAKIYQLVHLGRYSHPYICRLGINIFYTISQPE